MIDSTTDFTKNHILYQRLLRVIKTGYLLHAVSLMGVFLFAVCGWSAMMKNQCSGSYWFEYRVVHGFFSLCGIALIIFSQMDAKSRFQNYKQVKDLLYENGFQPRIINLFCISRCQRDAIRVAAIDLKMNQELDAYYKKLGYRWFHVVPDFVFSRPRLFFSWRYWQKTLFEKSYTQKYFLW